MKPHQCLQDSPGHELLSHLPLRREYVQALRSGGILAARSVAMSVMVQLGGFLLHCLTRGCDIIDERVLVPLLRLRRLTAATLLTAIEAWMPCTPLNPGKLAELVTGVVFLMHSDGASSNLKLKMFCQLLHH